MGMKFNPFTGLFDTSGGPFVKDTGDTMTGQLTINRTSNARALHLDIDTTNVNSNVFGFLRVEDTTIVDNGSTYTKTNPTAYILSEVTETSGTITDSSDVLLLEQKHADNTGNILNIANAGDGFALKLKNSDGVNQQYIQLLPSGTSHYPFIKWYDNAGVYTVGLTAHENHPTDGVHEHFTIYTTDANDTVQGRVYLEYAKNDPDMWIQKIGTFIVKNHSTTDLSYRKNRNVNDNAMEVELSLVSDDGGTHTLQGNALVVTVDQTETSGTITASADVLLLEQLGDTGKGLVIDNRATGSSIQIKNNTTENFSIDNTGVVNTTASYKVDGTQVVSNRVIDARIDDTINSGDGTTDGVIDAIRDALITHGLIAAA